MELSIAIVNWNTKELLEVCLSSVFATLDGIEAEVIVVDNCSSDGSVEMVAINYPQARLYALSSNTGFARANNLAFSRSNGDCFLMLNSDTIVFPGSLKTLVDFLRDHPEAGAVGCKLLNADGTLQRSCSPFPTPLTELLDALYLSKLCPKSKLLGRYAMSYWDFSTVREVDFAGGSCLALRREALDQVGLLDENFFMYSEEADLCYRLKQGGWKILFTPDASIIHLGGGSSKMDVKRTLLDLYRSKHTFMLKHYGAGAAARYRMVVLVSALVRGVAWGLRSGVGQYRDLFRRKFEMQLRLLTWSLTGK